MQLLFAADVRLRQRRQHAADDRRGHALEHEHRPAANHVGWHRGMCVQFWALTAFIRQGRCACRGQGCRSLKARSGHVQAVGLLRITWDVGAQQRRQ